MPSDSRGLLELQSAVAGRYSLEREVRRGRLVIEFLGRDVVLDRPVVIKLLREPHASDPISRAGFLRAARSAAGLFHPNILPVHAVEEQGEFAFVVTPYVEAESLEASVLRGRRLGHAAVRRLVEEAALALVHAHARGIIHGDLGPSALLLERGSGRALIADFGLSWAVFGAGSGRDDAEGDGRLTPRPWHISPEQYAGVAPDRRSDLYALGAISRFALTGRPPGENPPAAAGTAGGAAPSARPGARLGRAWGPGKYDDAFRELATALDACLAEDPDRRPTSAAALAQAAAEKGGIPASLPASARRLLRRIRQFSPVVAVGAVILWLIRGDPSQVVFAPLFAAIVAWMGGGMLRDARSVLREGLDADLIRRILGEEARELAARDESGHAIQNFAIGCGGFIFGLGVFAIALGVLSALLGSGLASIRFDPTSIAAGLLCLLLFLAGPSVDSGSPLRRLDLGERMMVGRFGRLLFRLARVGLRDASPPGGDPGEPTEHVLAAAADALFHALPGELRDRFAEVPAAIRDLREHIQALNRHDEELAAALARLDAAGSGEEQASLRQELESARATVGARVTEAIAALEHLRLSMLRFSVGSGTEAEFTMYLRRAQQLHGEAAQLREARAEVRRILEPGPAPTGPAGLQRR